MADSLDNRRKKEEPRKLGGMKIHAMPRKLTKEEMLDMYQQATPEERKELRKYMGHVRRMKSTEA